MSGQARIRRGTTAPRKAPAARRRSASKGRGRIAGLVASLPVSPELLRRIGGGVLLALLVASIVVGIVAMKLPQMIAVELGEAVGRAGFAVRNIEVHGRAKMDRDAVINIAMDQQSRAMPLVDLEATRQRLKELGWVADARVSRRLPDTLVIQVVERRPTAIWQFQQRLSLIDQNGQVITDVDVANMPDLPLVIGAGANERVNDLSRLIEHAPTLKPMLAAASWVGQRRWDLQFQSGEILALPEGQASAAEALKDFARRDTEFRLLGQGFVRFDMRVPGRMVVRVSREPGRSITDDAKAAAELERI